MGLGQISRIVYAALALGCILLRPNLAAGCTPISKPPDMRAVQVQIRNAADLPDIVQRGTQVDVVLVRNSRDSHKKRVTNLLKNVTVLAVTRNSDWVSHGNGAIVTLLVSPDDALKLAGARSKGEIQIANIANVAEHP